MEKVDTNISINFTEDFQNLCYTLNDNKIFSYFEYNKLIDFFSKYKDELINYDISKLIDIILHILQNSDITYTGVYNKLIVFLKNNNKIIHNEELERFLILYDSIKNNKKSTSSNKISSFANQQADIYNILKYIFDTTLNDFNKIIKISKNMQEEKTLSHIKRIDLVNNKFHFNNLKNVNNKFKKDLMIENIQVISSHIESMIQDFILIIDVNDLYKISTYLGESLKKALNKTLDYYKNKDEINNTEVNYLFLKGIYESFNSFYDKISNEDKKNTDLNYILNSAILKTCLEDDFLYFLKYILILDDGLNYYNKFLKNEIDFGVEINLFCFWISLFFLFCNIELPFLEKN